MHESDDGLERRTVLRGLGGGLGLTGLGGTLPGIDTGETDETGGTGLMAARTQFYSQRAVAGKAECFRPNQREIYGPTDINAQTGNGGLSVGINDAGTLTVFRWPYPSHYDQLKYYTLGRTDDDAIEVLPNEGAFLGLVVDGQPTWLRDWDATQYYANDADEEQRGATDAAFSDEVVTVFTDPPLDGYEPLTVIVRDVVPPETDALARQVTVRLPGAPGERTPPDLGLIAFANVNPVVSKHPQYPIQDWCTEENNQGRARYIADRDAVVTDRSGVDTSTGEAQSVAVAMGFRGKSTAHQVGGDAHEPVATPAGRVEPTRDAYEAASAGSFPGNDQFVGQATTALATDLSFAAGSNPTEATGTVVLAAGPTPTEATATLDRIRDRPFRRLRRAKERWLGGLLTDAPLPPADEVSDDLRALCRRALVTLVTDTEATENRAIVASIATQAPYGEDWIRDGAYFNRALEVIGLGADDTDWVADRNRWYADIQQRVDDPRPSHPNTPPGNWAMNYYGDGVAGGPIPYEIDETGYGIWTLWSHYEHTGDEAYLADVYPAIQRAADFLVRCRDVETALHCPTWEDDRFQPQRATIVGAALVWKGLQAAAAAAATVGAAADASRYRTRQHEVGRAIDRHLYGNVGGDDTDAPAYGVRIGFPMAEVVWPVGFTPYATDDGVIQDEPVVDDPFAHPRIQSHLTAVWHSVSPAFEAPDGPESTGQYEVKGLLPLAMAQNAGVDLPADVDVRGGIDWLASRHATSDTHIMGEAWQVFERGDGGPEVRSIISQPHAWEQVLVYLAALEEYGEESLGAD